MNRREFLKTAALTAAGTVLGRRLSLLGAADAVLQSPPAADASIRNYHPAMRYRPMGKTGVDVSALGFGMMRLPLLDNGAVDEELSTRMVRHAIDNGLNYVDTAYMYLGGKSEEITGRILRDGYREKVYVATKCPWMYLKEPDDFERILDEQRQRLGIDCIDFYLIHSINGDSWNTRIAALGLLEKMEKAKADGKVRFIGFSFHSAYPVFKTVVDATPNWDFCQIQLNYLDTEMQAGMNGLRYAAEKGLGVSVMEPLRGGFLAQVPDDVQSIFDAGPGERSPVEWALDYLWDMPEVGVVLSGMSAMEHVTDNLAYAGRSAAGMLSDAERDVIAQATERFNAYKAVPCTGCEYCLPCPLGVSIPRNISVFNNYKISGDLEAAKAGYSRIRGGQASECIDCGVCEPQCPQNLAIPAILREIRATMEA